MGSTVSSPSDFTNINVNYAQGNGYYTTHTDVSNLLQISVFTDSTTPNRAEVGKLIKRVEAKIDDAVGYAFRPIIYRDEFHSTDFILRTAYPVQQYKDYIGFIQLERPKVMKIVRLEVWQGDDYKDIASATASYIPPVSGSGYTLTLGVGAYSFVLTEGIHFFGDFGQKTTAKQIVSAINEVFPQDTAQFTGETGPKSLSDTIGTSPHEITRNVSDFFYATTHSEDSKKVIISSLLPGDDGSDCTISSTSGSHAAFTDNQEQGRNDDFWMITSEGKIFFRNEYPFVASHGCRVTYVSGDSRVPSWVHETATKLVAAEVIRHDDNSILITETGSNIDLKAKHDILVEEAKEVLKGKKIVIYSL